VENVIFKARQWVENVRDTGQGLTFAGVGVHHQHGINERRIRELKELARMMTIRAHPARSSVQSSQLQTTPYQSHGLTSDKPITMSSSKLT
jgi:hypothetical protein